MATNGTCLPINQIPAYIEGLCDIVVNKKRDDNDFHSLIHCLEKMPKECTPFKGKILQHLNIHALGNSNVNLRLVASCYARATLLFRKTPNKNDGPLGAWKSGLLKELLILEENLDHLYQIVGLRTNKIIKNSSADEEDDGLKTQEKLSESNTDYESIINDHLLRINLAAHYICALISLQTEFELPIPIFVLLKMASKVSSLRWVDFRKKPNGIMKLHVFSLTPYLIDIGLMLFQSIVTALGTNIIPYISFINQTIMRMLEWTRTSNLIKHDESHYHSARSHLFRIISFIAEQLSLNINLEPQLLQVLLEVELVDNLGEIASKESNVDTELKESHQVEALNCLESLMLIYSAYLSAPLEKKVKSYVLQACIKIYRDFDSNITSVAYRRQLLRLLQTIANQPYATSTTEMANHVFELAERLESDPEMRSVARRSIKLGLAHRPTIVTHLDVYNCYGRPMSSVENVEKVEVVEILESADNDEIIEIVDDVAKADSIRQSSPDMIVTNSQLPSNDENHQQEKEQEQLGDEKEIESCMSYFVEKLVHTDDSNNDKA